MSALHGLLFPFPVLSPAFSRQLSVAGRIGALLIALSSLLPISAFAHGVFIFGWEEGGRICTESYFSKSQKVRQGTVQMLDAAKNVLAQGEPDTNGAWCTPTPAGQKEILLVINAGEGHRGEFRLDISNPATPQGNSQSHSPSSSVTGENPRVVPPVMPGKPLENAPRVITPQHGKEQTAPESPAQPLITVTPEELQNIIRESVQAEVAPLRRMLAEAQEDRNTPSLTGIIGGIGWLVGLCGLGSLLSRKRKE